MEEIVSTPQPVQKVKTVDLDRLREVFDAALAEAGIVLPEKALSRPELMKLMIAEGVDPKKNILTTELLRMRYGCDEDDDQ